MTKNFILALDQGTTSSRAILFDREGVIHGSCNEEFPQIYPRAGWVEGMVRWSFADARRPRHQPLAFRFFVLDARVPGNDTAGGGAARVAGGMRLRAIGHAGYAFM